MKKLLLTTLFLGLFISTSNAKSSEDGPRVFHYAGIGYQHNNIDYKTDHQGDSSGCTLNCKNGFERDYSNAHFLVGHKLTSNIAMEVGYFRKRDENKNDVSTGIRSKTNLRVINLDTVFSLPITSGSNHKLIGIVSLLDIKHSSQSSLVSSIDDNGYGYGIGAGVRLGITDSVAVEIYSKISEVEKIHYIDDIVTYGINIKAGVF